LFWIIVQMLKRKEIYIKYILPGTEIENRYLPLLVDRKPLESQKQQVKFESAGKFS